MLERSIVEITAFFIFGTMAISCLLFWESIEKRIGTFWSWLIVPLVIFFVILLLIVILVRLFPDI